MSTDLAKVLMSQQALGDDVGGGDDYGIGDNGDGSWYIYDNNTGETILDNMTYDETQSWFSANGSGLEPGTNVVGGDASGGNSTSGNWWGSWGSGVANLLTNTLKTFFPGQQTRSSGSGNSGNSGSGSNSNNPGSTVIPQISSGNSTLYWVLGSILAVGVLAAIYFTDQGEKKTPKKEIKPDDTADLQTDEP
jgi:hypothetical protein